MSSQQFYLLGEAASSAKTIEVDTKSSVEQLKHLVAAHFAIVEPNGQLQFFSQRDECMLTSPRNRIPSKQ